MKQPPLFLLVLSYAFALILSFAHSSHADDNSILTIVSDRSASTLVAGAHQYLKQFPGQKIQIRTVGQISELNNKQLQKLLDSHKTLLLIAVFGDSVERLLGQQYSKHQQRFVFQGDRRLLTLHNDANGAIFSNTDLSSIRKVFDTRLTSETSSEFLKRQSEQWPRYQYWLRARAYWSNRSVANVNHLFRFILQPRAAPPSILNVANVRFFAMQKALTKQQLAKQIKSSEPIIWLLDHDTGDRPGDWALHKAYCEQSQFQCISVLAGWGAPSVSAIDTISELMQQPHLQQTPWAIVSLQDFVIGGGEGRQLVSEKLATMNVPILKAVRLTEWAALQWQLSSVGLPTDSVHYRIAMPELQGIGQSQIVAVASIKTIDARTGARLQQSEPLTDEVNNQVQRLQRWFALQTKNNQDKRIAIVYYNHPPGRHNIGADNLNVPESLLEILQALQKQGYDTGELPETADALLDILQQRGVNLPNDKQALEKNSKIMNTLTAEQYQSWFVTLPKMIQKEMVDGPLGQLQQLMLDQISQLITIESLTQRQQQLNLLDNRMKATSADLHHALDGVRHPSRERALDLLEQLEDEYHRIIAKARLSEQIEWNLSESFSQALIDIGIEGIRGWGAVPGEVMVWDKKILIPGIQFGNVYVGPQPPRGWELNEELLHANMSFPPTHQYLAFYYFLREQFLADAVIHIGRHSTYEFLPKRSVGLGENDYPSIVLGSLPSIYPYIVDGVGEGIQAKRRGQAIMVDHLTPPLAVTELYDNLLQVRQLIESAEAAGDDNTRSLAVKSLRHKIDVLNLRDELIASMDEELQVRGVGFDQIDDEFLLHEVGHYLTNIQETFMPLGLHVFGRDWLPEAIATMLTSMSDGKQAEPEWRNNLQQSPSLEKQALLNALSGGYVAPGKGNDPIRTADALPTGRNFYALDGSLLPTQVGFNIGRQLAEKVLAVGPNNNDANKNKQAIILWASDAVRDEGAMIAFGMNLLGVKPIWNSRGIIKGLERLPLSKQRKQRLDVVFSTSGLFRDLYGEHLVLLDKAVLLALDASRDTIIKQYPALALALTAALQPLGELQQGGNETLEANLIAANWVNDARELLTKNSSVSNVELGRQASLRIFGTAPGAYGAGINRLVERSGAWSERRELGQVYLKRMGHAYGVDMQGDPMQAVFRQQLSGVSDTYLGRASHLYGLIDNNDAFDYLGGLNLAIETVTGTGPRSSVINHSDSEQLRIDPLPQALLSELRGRFLNPQWIKPLIKENYAGARTMGSEFVEYLWGWQVTSPDIIDDWVWQEVKAVYIDDSLGLGLDEFLARDHNVHVQSNMLAVMLVAIDKGFWQADAATIQQLAQQFANNIIKNGIPGSGHTHAKHPIYDFVKSQLSAEQAETLELVLAKSRMPDAVENNQPTRVQEINLEQVKLIEPEADKASNTTLQSSIVNQYLYWLLGVALLVMLAGIVHGQGMNSKITTNTKR